VPSLTVWGETRLEPSLAVSRWKRVLIIAVSVPLIVVLVFPLWLWCQQSDSRLELKVVRQTLEDGRTVAYFRLLGCRDRRIQIGEIEQLAPDRVLQWADWLAVFRDPNTAGRRDLRLVGPTDVPVWKLRVTVHIEQSDWVARFKTALNQWQSLRTMKYTVARTLKEIWTTPVFSESRTVESDWITNSTPTVQARNH
jgi:hypothetical protein